MATRPRWNAASDSAEASSTTPRRGRWAVRAEGRPDAVPRYATPRRHDRPTRGPRKAKIARALGLPFMPWQADLADVAGEYNPETGRPYYGVVIATVPRQSGKTTTILTETNDRAINWPAEEYDGRRLGPQQIAYTAQNGQAATKKVLTDQLPLMEDSELISEFLTGIRRTNGDVTLTFFNRSTYRPLPTTPDAGHGLTLDLAFIDEGFSEGATPVREGALMPTMLTRAHSQLWIVSTVGTESDVWFNEKVELGRAAVDEGADSGICYVEYSAEDPDVDIDDEEVWWQVMPALGYTQSIEAVRLARDTLRERPGEFRRAYLNIPTVNNERLIPASSFDDVLDSLAEPGESVVLGVDADPDLNVGSVVACDAAGVLELIDTVPLGDLVNLTVAVSLRFGAAVAVDKGGPLASKVADLKDELGEKRVIEADAMGVTQAAAELYNAIADKDATFRDDTRFRLAAAAATKRKVGDRWAFVRHPDAIPIVASSLAYWARRHASEPEPEPEFLSL